MENHAGGCSMTARLIHTFPVQQPYSFMRLITICAIVLIIVVAVTATISGKGTVTVPINQNLRLKIVWYKFEAHGTQCSVDIFTESRDPRIPRHDVWTNNGDTVGTYGPGPCTPKRILSLVKIILDYACGKNPECEQVFTTLKQLVQQVFPLP
jgi:hypothetical protein